MQSRIDKVTRTPSLISFWTFQESSGTPRLALGPYPYELHESNGKVERANEGIFGNYSARFGTGSWLQIARAECPALNLRGKTAELSVVAWLKRQRSEYTGCQAVAGLWNEHGLRQYCMFLNLHIHDSAEQVGAHVSSHGGATPGFKYCMDAAIGATPVPWEEWHCAVITYDGRYARAYLDGKLDSRGERNPFLYEGGIFDSGETGSDFTVGAVCRPEWVDENFQAHGSVVANPYYGLLGGLAVFDRALSDPEIEALNSTLR